MPRRCLVIGVFVLALGALAVGCGGGGDEPAATTATVQSGAPALATRPAAEGEIVVTGEASPMTQGPLQFDGRYLVRFEQYAPEDPSLSFASQTPFTAVLVPRQGDARGAVKLFETARASGRRELTIRGRRYVDVRFGDFPFVLRFTPRGG